MKKVLGGAAIALLIGGIGVYAFRAPLQQALVEQITADMFVAEDADSFDPGVGVGEAMPTLHASIGGREVASINEFAGPRGSVLIVNRSVDW